MFVFSRGRGSGCQGNFPADQIKHPYGQLYPTDLTLDSPGLKHAFIHIHRFSKHLHKACPVQNQSQFKILFSLVKTESVDTQNDQLKSKLQERRQPR